MTRTFYVWLAVVGVSALVALLISWQLGVRPVWYASSTLLSGGLTIITASYLSARRRCDVRAVNGTE